MKKDKNLRERSPLIQEIMGKIPPWVVRWGMSVVFVVLILIILVSIIVKYPEKVIVELKITKRTNENKCILKGLIREEDYVKVRKGMKVDIKLKGYKSSEYGILEGVVMEKNYEKGHGYLIKVRLKKGLVTSFGKRIKYYEGMSGRGEIIINQERFINIILHRMFYSD